jgi:hypothetical protein
MILWEREQLGEWVTRRTRHHDVHVLFTLSHLSPLSNGRSQLEKALSFALCGCSGHLVKAVNLYWYGHVHSANAWPPVEPTTKASLALLPIAVDMPIS